MIPAVKKIPLKKNEGSCIFWKPQFFLKFKNIFFEKILENIFWVMKIFCGNFDLYSELFFLVNITITDEIHTAGHVDSNVYFL